MTRKTLIIGIAVIAILVTGALVVMAQDDDDTPFPFGPGWMHQWDEEGFGPGMMGHGYGMMGRGHGPGMMGRGFGPGMMQGRGYGPGMMGADGEPMMLTVAEALGLEAEDLFSALREGQTLAAIAEAQGVELDAVYDAMFAEAEEHMAAWVESGAITQEQADAHLSWMREHIAEMPMLSGAGFGPGMMGHGYGMRWGNS